LRNLVIVALLIIIFSTLLIGCNSDYDEIEKLNIRISDLEKAIADLEKIKISKDVVITNLQEELQILKENTTETNNNKSDITRGFNFEDSFVSDLQMTTDGKYVTLILYDSFDYTGVYIYDSDKNKLTKLDGAIGFSSFWSSDNIHFIICDYSYLSAECELYSAETKEKLLSFSMNWGDLTWINEYEVIYGSENREIPLDSESDQYGTVDIVKHNLFTGKIVKLKEGTSQYYYTLQNIDGKLTCYKRYVNKDDNDLDYEIVDIFN